MTPAERKYEPGTYWEQRLSQKLDLTTVGHQGLGHIYNTWLYRARFRAMRRALRKINLDTAQKSLIDVGVGSGAWIPFWQKCGISRMVGVDITSVSVHTLAIQYPQISFFQGNICSWLPPVSEESFDIVTAFDVLFHVVDDVDFSRAISNISRLVKLGGWVVISDSFCSNPFGPFSHEYHRTYHHFFQELDAARLRPTYLEPIFFTMSTTLCNSRLKLGDRFTKATLDLVSKLASRRSTQLMNHLIGCSLYLLDGTLHRAMKPGPSLKFLFTEKY